MSRIISPIGFDATNAISWFGKCAWMDYKGIFFFFLGGGEDSSLIAAHRGHG
jgi:hypothetical protein